ncbi:ADP-ribosylglycohydrolase family protein [soil metagenome]
MKLRQDRVIGCLLGMAIGDALGMPFTGFTAQEIDGLGLRGSEYRSKLFEDGTNLKAGEFTDESEGALCIVESFTANTGSLDIENIRARLHILARGESHRWMAESTLTHLRHLDENDTYADLDESDVGSDIAIRGVPLGLIHAGRDSYEPDLLFADARTLAEVTHPGDVAAASIARVAELVRSLSLGESKARRDLGRYERWVDDASSIGRLIDDAYQAYVDSVSFSDAVDRASRSGGSTDGRGALTGAFAGAALGTSGIPQGLIDGLEGRVYIMLAGPWFYQSIKLRGAFAGGPGAK